MERRVSTLDSGRGSGVQRVFSRFSRSRRMATLSCARDLLCVNGPSTFDLGSSSSRRSKTESVTGPRSSRLVSCSAILTSCPTELALGPTDKSSGRFSAWPPRRNRACPCSERAAPGGVPEQTTLPTPPVFAGRSPRRAPPKSGRQCPHAWLKDRARLAESFDENGRAPSVPEQFPGTGVRRRPGCVQSVRPGGPAPAHQVERCHYYLRRPPLQPCGVPL